MSDKLSGVTVPASQPGLAETLVAAIHENEAVLARVARLLHDDVSQVLSAVGLQLDAMRMDFREQTPGLDERAAEIQSMLEQAIEQLRDISNELNPSIVERAGLQFAMERMAGKVRKSFDGSLRLHFDPAVHIPTALATTFYKIAECAVDNALARPGCALIEVKLKRLQGEFILEVRDNGRLDDADSNTLTWGRFLMDYYAKKRLVALTVETSPDGGTVVRASFPAPAEVPENDG